MSKLKLKWTTLLAIMIMAGMISCSSTGGTGGGFTVTLSSSSTNVTATSSITLTASATGGTLASVQFLKNGAAIGAPVTAAPFQAQVDLSSADNGSLSFTATATDTTGKTDTSDAVTVAVNIPVDNTPPTVSLATSAATVSDAGSITLTATASDDVGVARVEFFKNGTFIGQAFAAPFSFQAFLTQSDNGSLSFTAKAFDAAGNSSESSPVGVTVNISVATLLRPSKSGSIAISGNNNYIVQVNPENDNVSIFRSAVENGTRVVTKTVDVPVGVEPSSVVIHPDDKTAFVAVRGEAKVVKIADISTATAAITATAAVGSEPTGIALSPSGKLLAVAEFGESRISLVDTTTMAVISSVEIRNPRALAITNDGDNDDTDEKLIVTEFYGEVIPGTVEGQDNTRKGVVRSYALTTLAPQQKTEFLPLAVPDFVPNETSPNQLYAIEISPDNSKFMVVATAASPFSKAKFNENIFQLLLIGDVTTGAAISRINISAAIKNQVAEGKLFMADIVDLGLVGNNVIYFAARGADAFQRAELSGDSQSIILGAGATRPKQVDLLNPSGCQAPIGLVIPHDLSDNGNMYVNCWVSRSMAVVNLAQQSVSTVLPAGAAPVGAEVDINKGLRFYFTGRARWSNESWSSCGSCHPDGLSDNITWQFPAGPRQTVSMDGTFSKGPGAQKERILNWTAIFDELHDFERNTRGVSGGIGAIVSDVSLDPSSQIDISTIGGLAKPLKELGSVINDWEEIELWVKTIRPPLGKRFTAATSITNGRTLFDGLGCASCHGGQGWTLSRKFYEPTEANNAALLTTPFSDIASPHTFQIQAELGGAAPVAPPQVSCVLRQVGTFGVVGNVAATNALEIKEGNVAARAQGEFAGYNIPSLYGLQAGAPYLHHGQAATLEELLDPAGPWTAHLQAGNPNFAAILDTPAKLADLVNFLLSIDASTTEFAVPGGADKCPVTFP